MIFTFFYFRVNKTFKEQINGCNFKGLPLASAYILDAFDMERRGEGVNIGMVSGRGMRFLIFSKKTK